MKVLENVCIIDDDHIFIYGVKRLIEETSFCENLLVYQNGQDALDGLKEKVQHGGNLPSLIFLDLNMPMMTGWEFLDEYLQINEQDPTKSRVYIVSSSVDPKDLLKIKEYSVIRNYILKPVTADDLQNIVIEST
ncbi:MAG: response regulator [Flavobacteriaceae bacterium]